MNLHNSTAQITADSLRRLPGIRARPGVRLTAVERKYVVAVVDLLLANASLVIAVTVWNSFSPSAATILAYNKWFITLSVVWLIVGNLLDIYSFNRSVGARPTITIAAVASVLATVVYVVIPWLTPPLTSRIYPLGLVLLTTASVATWRLVYVRTLAQPAFSRRAIVLASGASAQALTRALLAGSVNPFRDSDYQVVGLVTDETHEVPHIEGLPWLGTVAQLLHLGRQHRVDEIVVAFHDRHTLSAEAYHVLLDCREVGLAVTSLAAVYEQLTGRVAVDYAMSDLRLVLSSTDSPSFRLYAAAKRLLDILIGCCGLVVLVQLAPIVAIVNRLTSPGPLLYRQQRIGQGGKPFAMFKLRSMIPDAERVSGVVWCADHDPRITPMGRLLRKTRLDEFPQFINVLRGEMSIVGPRPERPQLAGCLAHALPLYRMRHAVKPGITGWAQVCYGYADSVEEGRIKLEYDLFYVKYAGLYLDLRIMLRTLPIMLGLKGH